MCVARRWGSVFGGLGFESCGGTSVPHQARCADMRDGGEAAQIDDAAAKVEESALVGVPMTSIAAKNGEVAQHKGRRGRRRRRHCGVGGRPCAADNEPGVHVHARVRGRGTLRACRECATRLRGNPCVLGLRSMSRPSGVVLSQRHFFAVLRCLDNLKISDVRSYPSRVAWRRLRRWSSKSDCDLRDRISRPEFHPLGRP